MAFPGLELSFDRWFVGGSIGAGLFVGSGGALSTGGPASLVRIETTVQCFSGSICAVWGRKMVPLLCGVGAFIWT